jgi:hypothetical protein
MAEILGLHVNKLEAEHFQHMAALNSAWHLLLDPPEGAVAAIVARSPGSKVVARPYVRDAEYHDRYLNGDPQAAGRWAAALCVAQRSRNPGAHAWIVLNEPPCDTPAKVARLALADIAFMQELDRNGMKGCIGAFSSGNLQLPTIDGGAALRAYEPALRYAAGHGHYLSIHLYIAARPAMGGATASGAIHDPLYWSLRWHRALFPWLRQQGIPIPKTIVTEFGLDLGFARAFGYTGDAAGWRVPPPWGYGDDEAGANAYAADLLAMANVLRLDPEVQGLVLYCAGDNGDARWRPFMADGYLLSRLAGMAFPQPGQTPPPTGGFMIDRRFMGRAGLNENYSRRPDGTGVKGVILHHTGGNFAGSLDWLTNSISRVGAHYLFDRDGAIYQLVEDADAAWHAGYSLLNGLENCNNFTLGAEIVNLGDGADPYTPQQIAALEWFLKEKSRQYGFGREWVETHKKVRADWKARYPNAVDENGNPISHKTDPRGLDVPALLDRVYPPPPPVPEPKWDKVVWSIEEAARILLREGYQREHDIVLSDVSYVDAVRERDN